MRYNRISADCHLDMPWMPPALFTENASNELKERMPYVTDGPDGPMWVTKSGANFGLKNGVGMIVILGREMFNPNLIMLGICIIGVTGYAVDASLLLIQRKVLWWKPE